MPDYLEQRPLLVFWETTRACLLACRHCRASAQPSALPGELSTSEGMVLIDEIARFGHPSPVLVMTGGDCLLRPDIFDLLAHARDRHVVVAVSPTVTPRLNDDTLRRLAALGVRAASLSLDGAVAATHDAIRGVPGHFSATVAAMHRMVEAGFSLQVNTTVMSDNVGQLADIAALVSWAGARTWEVFFLIAVGRGTGPRQLRPEQCEAVCHLLAEVSRYGLVVRTVEGPFYRRVATTRAEGDPRSQSLDARHPELDRALRSRLVELLGPAPGEVVVPRTGTRDGCGVIFVAYDGAILPSGFLPVSLGNVRSESLNAVYRDHPLLRAIRRAEFHGRCGRCEFRQLCGGSRARAYAVTGDPLGEDPACVYEPASRGGARPPSADPSRRPRTHPPGPQQTPGARSHDPG